MEKWISIKDRLPEYRQLCDVWVDFKYPEPVSEFDSSKQPPHRRMDYEYVPNVGVTKEPAFQEKGFYDMGLYEMAFLLSEGIITHWTPAPGIPV